MLDRRELAKYFETRANSICFRAVSFLSAERDLEVLPHAFDVNFVIPVWHDGAQVGDIGQREHTHPRLVTQDRSSKAARIPARPIACV